MLAEKETTRQRFQKRSKAIEPVGYKFLKQQAEK
jgi:hypothetical protein